MSAPAAVCIRTSTERPEAMEKGCFVLVGIREDSLLQAMETVLALHRGGDWGAAVPTYGEDVSGREVRIIQSYTSIVNQTVWLDTPHG